MYLLLTYVCMALNDVVCVWKNGLRFVGYGVGEAPSKTKEKASPEAMDARRWGGAAIVAWCTSNSDTVAVVRTHDVEVRRNV